MSENKITRRGVLVGASSLSVVGLAGCAGGGDVQAESNVEGVSVSNIESHEATILGTEAYIVTGTISNETDEDLEINSEMTFYNDSGDQIGGEGSCTEIAANSEFNTELGNTTRVGSVDSYEIILEENDDWSCTSFGT